MSKTDKTRPAWVKALDSAEFIVAEHDHGRGMCDLPERPRPGTRTAAVLLGGRGAPQERTRCRWTPSAVFWSGGMGRCGCSSCQGRDERRTQRRRERQRMRRALRSDTQD